VPPAEDAAWVPGRPRKMHERYPGFRCNLRIAYKERRSGHDANPPTPAMYPRCEATFNLGRRCTLVPLDGSSTTVLFRAS
jgi:hypothetical protein